MGFKEVIVRTTRKMTVFDYVIIAIVVSYSVGFSLLSVYRYQNFMYYIDLGAHTQALYTTAFDGRLLYENYDALNAISREGAPYFGSYLGVHFSPLLLLLVPIFAVFPIAETLLILKSFAIGFSIIPAYLLAKRVLSGRASFLVATVYILNPALHALTFADFQASAFFPLLMLSSVYFLRKKQYPLYYLALVLSLMTVEFVSLLIAFYAFVELFPLSGKNSDKNGKGHLIATLFIVIAWFVASNLIMSAFKPQELSPVRGAIEGGIVQAISYRLQDKLSFLPAVVAPFGLLPLRSRYTLSVLPWVGTTLASTSVGVFQLGWHYGAYFLPFLYVALLDVTNLYWSKKYAKKLNFSKLMKALLVAGLLLSIILTPLDPITTGEYRGIAYSPQPFDNAHVDLINSVIELIPENATILAQTPLSQHLATRLNAYVYVPDLDKYKIDYILADSKHWDFINYGFDNITKSALDSGNFGLLVYDDGVYLLKRDYHGQVLSF